MESFVETIGMPATIVLLVVLTVAYAYLQHTVNERGDAENVQRMTNQISLVLAILALLALLVGLANLRFLVDGLSN